MIESFVCFDIETTGLNPTNDKIIEIGALRIRNRKVVGKFKSFINPHMKLPAKIKELTKIDDHMLRNAKDISEVIHEFVQFVEDDIIVGHNIQFDYNFIKVNAKKEKLSFEKKAIDTLKLSRVLKSDLESKSLGNMCMHYGIQNQNAHRAYDDAVATAVLYFKLLDECYENSPSTFEPVPLNYKVKKQESITATQKNYLNDLLKYHKINYSQQISILTKSDASRLIDKIILENGRII